MYWHAYMGEWGEMKAIVRNDPDSVRIPLTGSGDTALHVAAAAGNTTFVRELTKFMETEEQLIPNSEGMLSVHLAALSRHHRIVKHLCSQQHLLDKMAYEDIEKLFFMTISNNMFGKCNYNLFTPFSYLIIIFYYLLYYHVYQLNQLNFIVLCLCDFRVMHSAW